MTIARIFTHPETGEELTASEWAKKLGLSTSTFHGLVRQYGEDSPRCYAGRVDSKGGNPTQEWRDLCDLESTAKAPEFEAGTWERRNIKDSSLELVKHTVICRRGPLPDTSISEMEKPVYEAFKALGSARPVEVARRLNRTPGWVGKKAIRLAKKGYLMKIERGIYGVPTSKD